MIGRVKRDAITSFTGGAIAVGLIFVLAYCTFALINVEVPAANRDALMVLIGAVSMNVATIINYHFGTGADSKRTTEAVSDMAATARSIQAAASPGADVKLKPGDSVEISAEPKP